MHTCTCTSLRTWYISFNLTSASPSGYSTAQLHETITATVAVKANWFGLRTLEQGCCGLVYHVDDRLKCCSQVTRL